MSRADQRADIPRTALTLRDCWWRDDYPYSRKVNHRHKDGTISAHDISEWCEELGIEAAAEPAAAEPPAWWAAFYDDYDRGTYLVAERDNVDHIITDQLTEQQAEAICDAHNQRAAQPPRGSLPRKYDYNEPHPFESADLGNPTYGFCVCGKSWKNGIHIAGGSPTATEPPDDVRKAVAEAFVAAVEGYGVADTKGTDPMFFVDIMLGTLREKGVVFDGSPRGVTPALDVELLAEAIYAVKGPNWWTAVSNAGKGRKLGLEDYRREAEKIAAEYARLGSPEDSD